MPEMFQVHARKPHMPKRGARTKSPQLRTRIETPVVGRLASIGEKSLPRVEFAGAPGGVAIPARTTVPLDGKMIGREVVLVFELGDALRPIVTGVLTSVSESAKPSIPVEADGDRLVLTAEREVVLRCGDACIILTRAGKVLIRGAYVLSRSSGPNRIKGASVEIN